MTMETLRAFFGWCTILNWAVLLLWFVMLLVGSGFVYRVHGRLFDLDTAQLRAIHYRAMAYYTTGIMLFNLAPYLALRILA